jgi:hypothetical protein
MVAIQVIQVAWILDPTAVIVMIAIPAPPTFATMTECVFTPTTAHLATMVIPAQVTILAALECASPDPP